MILNTQHTDDQHHQVLLLLPWYLNQTLERSERLLVENHIRRCLPCRQELVRLDKLAAAVKQMSDLDVAADISFDSLRDKLQTTRGNRQQPELSIVSKAGEPDKPDVAIKRHKPSATFIANKWIGLAIAASLMLAIIPFTIQTERSLVDYYTLSDAKPELSDGPTLRVVFKNLLPDTEIDVLLSQIHGRRVEGPNSVGAYTVRLDTGEDAPSMSTAIDFLRNQQNVMLVEPVLN